MKPRKFSPPKEQDPEDNDQSAENERPSDDRGDTADPSDTPPERSQSSQFPEGLSLSPDTLRTLAGLILPQLIAQIGSFMSSTVSSSQESHPSESSTPERSQTSEPQAGGGGSSPIGTPDQPQGPSSPPPGAPSYQYDSDGPNGQFRDAWRAFVKSMRKLIEESLIEQPRYIDQFLQWSNDVLDIAERDWVADGLQTIYNQVDAIPANLLLSEYRAINQAVFVALSTERSDEEGSGKPKSRWERLKNLLGIGKTALDSSKDIFKKFLENDPRLSAIVTLLGEVLDVFKGN